MKEDEAKTKWCPMANGQGTTQDNKCIASECMWWVWDLSPEDCEHNPPSDWNQPIGHCGAIR